MYVAAEIKKLSGRRIDGIRIYKGLTSDNGEKKWTACSRRGDIRVYVVRRSRRNAPKILNP